MITVIPPRKGPKYPLLFQRPGELSLPAYLQLNLRGRKVTFGYWPPNNEPDYVTLGFEWWWEIDAGTTRREAVKIAKDVEPLLECMCGGFSPKGWDGHNNIGELNRDAKAAAAEVTARLQAVLDIAQGVIEPR